MTKQPFAEVVKGVIPFLIAALIALILLVVFPQISMFLPSQVVG